jgi:hypothetical protein
MRRRSEQESEVTGEGQFLNRSERRRRRRPGTMSKYAFLKPGSVRGSNQPTNERRDRCPLQFAIVD